jgi:hypothetical protein
MADFDILDSSFQWESQFIEFQSWTWSIKAYGHLSDKTEPSSECQQMLPLMEDVNSLGRSKTSIDDWSRWVHADIDNYKFY